MVRKKKQPPALYFKVGGDDAGFTPSGISGFGNIDPYAIVRELLQNSMDAAKEAGRDITRLRFEIVEHPIADIPGIDDYHIAFNQAERDQTEKNGGKLADQASNVVRIISNCLEKESICTLYVMDNGIGLDTERMESLLSDGSSYKADGSTGSFGNGHLTALPASDLRYVLYAGISGNNADTIAAGHTILASHANREGKAMGKDGYYVSALNDDFFQQYRCPDGNDIPAFLTRKFKWIKNRGGTGSIVAIAGFNYFREPLDDFVNIIKKAAACNFFAAFAEGTIEIEIVLPNGQPTILNGNNIGAYLESNKDEIRRTSSRAFLAGVSAHSAFTTINTTETQIIDTGYGNLTLKLNNNPTARNTRIDLCRNGMWITDNLPKLGANKFNDRPQFHCVILLDAKSGGKLHDIIRKAEGPLHNSLDRSKNLSRKDQEKLDTAMRLIEDKISELVPPIDTDSFRLDGVFQVNTTDGIVMGGDRKTIAGAFKSIMPSPPAPPAGDDDEDGNAPGGKKGGGTSPTDGRKFNKGGNAAEFAPIARATGGRSCTVQFQPKDDMSLAELWLALDENFDDSCAMRDTRHAVTLSNVRLDGQKIADKDLLRGEHDGKPHSILLHNLKATDPILLDIEYAIPPDIDVPDNVPIALSATLSRRQKLKDAT